VVEDVLVEVLEVVEVDVEVEVVEDVVEEVVVGIGYHVPGVLNPFILSGGTIKVNGI